MENRPIADTQYDLKFLVDILRKHDKGYPGFEEIASMEEKHISEDRGFGSNIYSVNLTSSKGERYSVVCKIPTVQHINDYLHKCNGETKKMTEEEVNRQEELNTTQVRETHNREVDFYQFTSQYASKDMKIPKFMYGEYMTEENEGIIIMEDLSHLYHKGPSQGLTKSEAIEMVDTICLLHVYCLQHQDIIQERFQPVDSLVHCIKGFITLGANDLLSKGYSWFNQGLAEKTIALASFEKLNRVMACKPELGMPPVICQGDLWPSNVLWQHREDGMRSLLAIIDWQDCFIGSYANDLASILAINMDYDVRKSCEREILQYYVDNMNGYKKIYKLDIDLSYEKVYTAYKSALQVALLIAMTILGNPEDVPENGDNIGRITKRFVHMLEDVEFE